MNYYASGSDSISYHSDDEKFLGELPAIASFSLGAKRDFLMKHKPVAPNDNAPPQPETKPIKLPLASGDMVLMRGKTQASKSFGTLSSLVMSSMLLAGPRTWKRGTLLTQDF